MSSNSLARIANCPRPGSEHDEITTSCSLCGEEHIGINTEATLQLKGSFMFSPEHGVALFVLDPDAQLTIMELPTGQLVIAPNIGSGISASHTECIDRMASELFDLDKEDDETDYDLDEDDDIDIETIYEGEDY